MGLLVDVTAGGSGGLTCGASFLLFLLFGGVGTHLEIAVGVRVIKS